MPRIVIDGNLWEKVYVHQMLGWGVQGVGVVSKTPACHHASFLCFQMVAVENL